MSVLGAAWLSLSAAVASSAANSKIWHLPRVCLTELFSSVRGLEQVKQEAALGLLKRLKQEGYALTCCSYPKSDLVLELQEEDDVSCCHGAYDWLFVGKTLEQPEGQRLEWTSCISHKFNRWKPAKQQGMYVFPENIRQRSSSNTITEEPSIFSRVHVVLSLINALLFSFVSQPLFSLCYIQYLDAVHMIESTGSIRLTSMFATGLECVFHVSFSFCRPLLSGSPYEYHTQVFTSCMLATYGASQARRSVVRWESIRQSNSAVFSA